MVGIRHGPALEHTSLGEAPMRQPPHDRVHDERADHAFDQVARVERRTSERGMREGEFGDRCEASDAEGIDDADTPLIRARTSVPASSARPRRCDRRRMTNPLAAAPNDHSTRKPAEGATNTPRYSVRRPAAVSPEPQEARTGLSQGGRAFSPNRQSAIKTPSVCEVIGTPKGRSTLGIISIALSQRSWTRRVRRARCCGTKRPRRRTFHSRRRMLARKVWSRRCYRP